MINNDISANAKEFVSEYRYLIKNDYSQEELRIVAIRSIKINDKIYEIPIPMYIFNIGMILSLDKATYDMVDNELNSVYYNFITKEMGKLL